MSRSEKKGREGKREKEGAEGPRSVRTPDHGNDRGRKKKKKRKKKEREQRQWLQRLEITLFFARSLDRKKKRKKKKGERGPARRPPRNLRVPFANLIDKKRLLIVTERGEEERNPFAATLGRFSTQHILLRHACTILYQKREKKRREERGGNTGCRRLSKPGMFVTSTVNAIVEKKRGGER